MEQRQSYGRHMWSIWSPLLIKFGISIILSMMFAFVLIWRYLAGQEAAGDAQALVQFMNNADKMQEMSAQVLKWAVDLAVPMEGAAALITIPVFLFLMHRDRVKEKAGAGEISVKRAPFYKYPLIIGISAAMCLGLNNLIVLSNLSSYSTSYEDTMEMLYQPSLWMQIVCLGILMPVCEELAYRGLMYRRTRMQMKFLPAALYSSVIFAITHGNLVQSLYGFAMGMMLSYVYEKYGSVLAPAAGHITANILSVAGTYFHWFDWMLKEGIRIGGVTVLCAAAASAIYVLMQRMENAFPETLKASGSHLAG